MNELTPKRQGQSTTKTAAAAASAMFAAVFPELSGKALVEAEANFDDYLAFVVRLYNRISEDPHTLAQLRADLAARRAERDSKTPHSLTAQDGRPTIQERSIPQLDN
jgi:hypothetical protein